MRIQKHITRIADGALYDLRISYLLLFPCPTDNYPLGVWVIHHCSDSLKSMGQAVKRARELAVQLANDGYNVPTDDFHVEIVNTYTKKSAPGCKK